MRILSINPDYSWQLDSEELGRILLHKSVKNKPVVVVSTAGAYRQGKSFLMNFFIRYMCRQGADDWLGHPDAPLEGFDWKHGSQRRTSGIVLWDKVFLATTSDGEEVAVLFMDTQGLFDCQSTMAECATIFALSVLTSSVQIYNILHNIQEDHLQHLEFFTQYGQLAQKESKGRPFQKLVFLVRDSNWGTYGAEPGRALVKERLESANNLRPENQLLRKSISANFAAIEGFLMPHPGSEVATQGSYDGRLSVADRKFKKCLQEFVPWILGPQHLVVKQINDKKISCQELYTYITAYVQAFKSGELPEPKNMLQATAEASHLTAKDKAVKRYMKVMSNVPHGDLNTLQQTHSDALAYAKADFNNIPKIGGDQMSKTYLDAMTHELQVYFDHIYKEAAAWQQEQVRLENKRREEQAEQEMALMELENQIEEKKRCEEQLMQQLEALAKENQSLETKISDADTKIKDTEKLLSEIKKERKQLKKQYRKLQISTAVNTVISSAGLVLGGVGLATGNPILKSSVVHLVTAALSAVTNLATDIAK